MTNGQTKSLQDIIRGTDWLRPQFVADSQDGFRRAMASWSLDAVLEHGRFGKIAWHREGVASVVTLEFAGTRAASITSLVAAPKNSVHRVARAGSKAMAFAARRCVKEGIKRLSVVATKESKGFYKSVGMRRDKNRVYYWTLRDMKNFLRKSA